MNSKNFLSELPTREEIENYIRGARESIESLNQSQTQRMENYYNCLDDYSYGGICDRACDESRRDLLSNIDVLTKQMESGKPIRQKFVIQELHTLDGTVASQRVISGRFGDCWMIGSGDHVSFVSCAKKASTYAQKGYKVMDRIYHVEYYYLAKEGRKKRDLITRGRLLSEKLVEAKNVTYPNTRLHSVAWFTINQNQNQSI